MSTFRASARAMLSHEDMLKIDCIERAATAVLTMTEGLEREEFARARLTRHSVRTFLLEASAAIEGLSEKARSALPELDLSAWRMTRKQLEAGEAIEGDTGWFAIRALTPATLGWLRFYRESQPALFAISA